MARVVEVEIDELGGIHPLRPGEKLPVGRALLTWEVPVEFETALLSEASLAVNWLSPEEDAAWAHLQLEK